MPATDSRVTAWPTLERVHEIVRVLEEADDDVENVSLELYGTTDADPHEPPPVMPSVENVAAMAALVEFLDDEIRTFQLYRDSFAELRDVAAYHVLHADG